MTPDLPKVRRLCSDNPLMADVLATVFAVQVKRRASKLETLLPRVKRSTRDTTSWTQLVGVFHQLAECGCGVLTAPHNRRRCVFKWAAEPKMLTSQILFAAPERPAAQTAPVPAGWMRYELRLREAATVNFDLPGDLTAAEAERLSHFVLSLPIES